MAYINLPANQPLYDAAQHFVDTALRRDDSLFAPGQSIWSLITINKLWHDFVEAPDDSNRSFEVKFKEQLAASDNDTILLAGELLYVHLLPVNGIKPDTKRNQILRVLSWAESPIATSIPLDLNQALEGGVAKAGTAFVVGKPFQLWFLLQVVRAFKQLAADERQSLLADPWAFKQFLFALPIEFAYSQRELLLHLVFPATFEAMMARDHKQQIATTFVSLISDATADVDMRILQIRQRLEAQYGPNFNFYDIRIKPLWAARPKAEPTTDDAEDDDVDDPAIDDKNVARTPVDLAEWQRDFASDNELARFVAQDYPAWLRAMWGDAIDIQPYTERLLHIFFNGTRVQELSLRRVRGVYVLLFGPDQWDIARLQTQISRPKSAKPRETWGFRCVITSRNDYELLKTLTAQTFSALRTPTSSPLPHALGNTLRPYVELVAQLDQPSYSAAQLVERLLALRSSSATLMAEASAETLAHELVLLRLLERLDEDQYRRWLHLADAPHDQIMRYAALTLLIPDGDDYRLPVLDAPLDGLPHALTAWPQPSELLAWYEEAGLVNRNADGTWQALPDALAPLPDTTPMAQALNTFLANLRRVQAQRTGLAPLDNAPLRTLSPAVLNERIAEIQRELLVEHTTVLRIYRSLIAGQHVILSGPPGTGKTHLARMLPGILWRDEHDTVVLHMPDTPELLWWTHLSRQSFV